MKKSYLESQIGGSHYLNFKIQLIEFFVKNDIRKPEGDIIQYILRPKGQRKEDLQKAKHILEMMIELENE